MLDVTDDMCRYHDSLAQGLFRDKVFYKNTLFWIQTCCRLIKKDNFRFAQKGLNQHQSLFHSSGKRRYFSALHVIKLKLFKQVLYLG